MQSRAIFAGVGLRALAPAPEDVDACSQFRAQVHGAHGLLHGVGAHLRIVGGEGAVLEDGIGEEVGGRHRHLHAVVAQRLFELADDCVALGGGGIDGHQVVVMEVDAVRAEFANFCTM